jgi:hypothetical protein
LAILGAMLITRTALSSVQPANAPVHEATLQDELNSWTSPVLPQMAAARAEPELLAQAGTTNPVDVYGFKRKSPARAFLQSFLIPGWGQLYAKSSFWKPVLFVGIEAAGWAGYASYHGKGRDQEKLFKAYATDHWSGDRYVQGLKQSFYLGTVIEGTDDGHLDTLQYRWDIDNHGTFKTQSFSHHAFYKNDGSKVPANEYFENVGKYDQFNFGWDDYRDSLIAAFGSSDISAVPVRGNNAYAGADGEQRYLADSAKLATISRNRNTYLHMRAKANDEYNKADKLLVMTVANHLLSAFWAALDARAYNRAQDQFSRVEPKVILVKSPADPTKLMPQLWLSYRF